MRNYRRPGIAGGTYFITQVTYQRHPWLCSDRARYALRTAINDVRQNHPFAIEAFVLLPDHFHCLWTLPPDDNRLSTRMRLVKAHVTRHAGADLAVNLPISASRQKRHERNLWQRRFWDHLIQNDTDFKQHCDYIHYNPVHHQHCKNSSDWQFSSFHRFVAQGTYPSAWGHKQIEVALTGRQYDI